MFFEEGSGERVVLGIERVVAAPNWGLPRQAVVAAARRKYGEPASADITDYQTELLWGKNVVSADGYSKTLCNAVGRSERIDDWVDQGGTRHKIYEYFNWDNARGNGMTELPGLDYFLQDEFSVYQECGVYLRLLQNSNSLRTLLVDLKIYATDYMETRRLIEESFASDLAEELGTEIKL
ncbi:MAG TPA: hypothetical protein ENK61_01655 [Devosia sp.]|nr:hypothetical protein [Devosia sp.]